MNKQEILEEIKKTEEHLVNMRKMLKECEYERWKPKEGEKFFFIDKWSRVCYKNYKEIDICCRECYNTYNCFKTEKQAEQEAEKILVRRQLEDIARRLNKGEKIDWLDDTLNLFTICYDFDSDEIGLTSTSALIKKAEVYCLNQEFAHVATQEIGEERLKKYLRGE